MVFPWKLLVSSIYPCYFTGAYLGMDHFTIYFEWDFHSFGSGHVLVLGLWSFLSCCFLHSLFLELLLLDVDIPQLILQFSYLFSSVVHLCLVIRLPRLFLHLLFSSPSVEIFILTFTIFYFPDVFSSLHCLCSFQALLLCLFACLLFWSFLQVDYLPQIACTSWSSGYLRFGCFF